MTVRHWLELLIVPLVIAGIGFWFTAQQDARMQQIEDQRAASEQELEAQRAQDAALQAYLDQMTALLLEKDLRNSEVGSEVQTLAQARTLTVLERSDPSRKTEVMRFLVAAQLVQVVDGNEPVILLYRADLHGADLRNADLRGAELDEAPLYSANLRGADLREADLRGTDLRTADLTAAKGVDIEQLEQQAFSLEGATLPNGQKYEEWLKSKGSGEDGENSDPS
jgi:hypothetical protein